MEKEVVSYIQEAREHGLSDLEIKKNLLDAGWEAGVVEESFSHARVQESKAAAAEISRPVETEKPAPGPDSAKQPAAVQKQTAPAAEPAATVQPQVELSEKHFLQPATGKNHKRLWVTAGVVAGIAILGGGGYYYYTQGFSSPAKVWEKYLQAGSSKIYENKFQWSYQDNGSLKKEENKTLGIELKNMRIGFDGVFYVDNTDSLNPQSSSDVQYTFASGNTSFSTGFKYRLVNKSLYINIGENPFMDAIFNSLSDEGKRYDWIKIDLEELDRQSVSSTSSADEQLFKEVFNDEFVKQLEKVWEDSSFVRVDKYVGRESINGNSTLHFKNTLDKEAVKRVAFEYIDKIAARFQEVRQSQVNPQPAGSGLPEELPTGLSTSQDDINRAVSLAKTAVEELVNKLEIKEFETWVGLKDFKLYRIHLASNAPSIISAIKLSEEEYNTNFNGDSADVQRLSDMRKLADALVRYYEDNNRYPESKDGIPLGLAPKYISEIPAAPEPPGGTCTPYYNTYWYEVKNETSSVPMDFRQEVVPGTDSEPVSPVKKGPGISFEYTFCLGRDTGGYSGGIAMLSPKGISDNITCPGKQEDCVNPNAVVVEKSEEDKLKEFIQKLEFNGEMKVDAEYTNYGKTRDLEKPSEYFDLLDAIQKQEQRYQSVQGSSPTIFRDSLKAGYLLSKYLK